MLRAVALFGLLMVLAAGCGEGNVFELKEGDCFNERDPEEEEEVADVDIVSCDDPHQYEVYAVASIEGFSGQPYPGDALVDGWAVDLCLERFDEFVARPYADSLLEIFTLMPTRESWERLDDREITCSLYDLEYTYMEGSMQGSGR